MDTYAEITSDRVRKTTSDKRNAEIDRQTDENIRWYSGAGADEIKRRIKELDEEWDIERTLEVNAGIISLAGIVLAATVSKKWLILPAIVTGFLTQHAIQGWCPPVPFFRSMNIRTRKEIDREKYALLETLGKMEGLESIR